MSPQVVLYLPVLAVWLTLVGASLNRAGAVVIAPLAVGAAVGVAAVLTVNYWLLIPVVLAWLVGVVLMVVAERKRAG
ncbi:hypothetical protein [Actinokineospora sp. NPDC004072]